MIDEELYQQASEELASERRDLRVWARACSLAPEDHDEARYLYTNLRVEELLAERDGRGNADGPQRASSAASDPASAPAIGAASVPDSDGNDRGDTDADGDIDTLFATLEDEDEKEEEARHAVAEASALDDTEARAMSSVPAEPRSSDRESAERTDVERREITTRNEHRDSRSWADEARDPGPNADTDTDTDDDDDDDDDDDFDWLGRERDVPGERIERDAVRVAPASDEAERQELRGEVAADSADRQMDALVLELQERASPTPSPASFVEPVHTCSEESEWAREGRSDERRDTVDDGPMEIDTGRGVEYAVYRRDGSREQAVKRGGSIGALLLTVPWLLYRHLFGTTLLYLLFALAVLAGLTMTGLAWIDAGAAAPVQTKGATVAFALLALFGLFVAPWRQGNRWRQGKLERRGFSLVAHVRAPDAKTALRAAERASGNHLDAGDASAH